MPANPRNMRVRVDREALIQAIERKRNQCRKDYELLGDEHTQALVEWQKEQVAKLETKAVELTSEATQTKKAAAELKKFTARQLAAKSAEGARNNYRYLTLKTTKSEGKGYRANFSFDLPRQREGTQLTGFDNILRMLRMSKEKSVSLNEAQFAAYMEGCPVNTGR